MWREVVFLVLSACASWMLTWRVRLHALSRGMLDMPNARSSHKQPTPRGGGLAILIVVVLGLMVSWSLASMDTLSLLAYGATAIAVGAVGYLDDKSGLPVLPRFGVHLLAAAVAATVLLNRPDGSPLFEGLAGWPAWLVAALGIVWSVNLFNFMDGIDGIAGSQAVFVAGASAVLAIPEGAVSPWLTLSVVTTGASLGFLIWNWPPAKIFMGDVGSGFLGFWLAVLAIGLHVSGGLDVWTSIILGAVFIADATATLVRRILGGERWYEAHRSHAYQHLALRWASHGHVTALVWAINLLLVLPLAYASTVWRGAAVWIALGLLLVLAVGCLAAGAGKQSSRPCI